MWMDKRSRNIPVSTKMKLFYASVYYPLDSFAQQDPLSFIEWQFRYVNQEITAVFILRLTTKFIDKTTY